jgi:hypothetical protein
MICGIDEDRLRISFNFPQNVVQRLNTLVDSMAALMVHRQFRSALGCIRKKDRDIDRGGINLVDRHPAFRQWSIAEGIRGVREVFPKAAASMRIGGTEVKKKRTILGTALKMDRHLLSHSDRIAFVPWKYDFKGIGGIGCQMEFADANCLISRIC